MDATDSGATVPQKNQEGNVVKRRHARTTSSKTWVLAGNILALNQQSKSWTALKMHKQKPAKSENIRKGGESIEGNKIPGSSKLRNIVL